MTLPMLLVQTFLAASGILVLLPRVPPAVSAQYTNWTQLPACAQTCFSTSLLQAFGSCGSILSSSGSGGGNGGNNATTTGADAADEPPSARLRRCICTDCSYRAALGACLDGGCAAGAGDDGDGDGAGDDHVDGSLALNDRVFCNKSVEASVQMWDRNLVWVVGQDSPARSASADATRGGVWTCSGTSSASTSTAISGSSSSTSEVSATAMHTTTVTATLTLVTTSPYQATVEPGPGLTISSDKSTSISPPPSPSTSLGNSSRSMVVTPTTPALSPSSTTSSSTTSASGILVPTTGTNRAERPIPPFELGMLLGLAVAGLLL
ncbi:uncharacterized protein PV07_09479 [Cladophialophora immunda]|uniref:Extracellular membrane protein CFEM domain-containing protein n=1 Tax=Cladophialophora immunda TaxID=569365 RepID=A0A0D2C7A2_9EURO|nr:uncharacterized protein PV07_09479 [Cladophialophora immunda]KIW26380.1 hypothetical protein PV07_09479 [Cladophialophora immunda]